MTLANRITMSRMFSSLIIFTLIALNSLWSELTAFGLFTIASISDYFDGAIARRTKTMTSFGAIADPFADKILIMAAFLAFASVKTAYVPLWAVFLILLRELTISTLRVLAALNGEVLKAESIGKFKTCIQMSTAFIILALLVLEAWHREYGLTSAFLSRLRGCSGQIAYWLTVLTALTTVLSGAVYLYRHRALLRKSWSQKGHGPR